MEDFLKNLVSMAAAAGPLYAIGAIIMAALLIYLTHKGIRIKWPKVEPVTPPKPPVDVGGPEIPDAEWQPNTDLDNRPPG